jgi:hypothetical protein
LPGNGGIMPNDPWLHISPYLSIQNNHMYLCIDSTVSTVSTYLFTRQCSHDL